MKNNEASLFVIVSTILSFFLVFFVVVHLQELSFTSPIVKKDLMLIIFIISLLIYAAFTNSFSKAFVILYPFLFEINRTLLFISDYITLPPVLKTMNIDVISIIPLILFLIFFDVEQVLSSFKFKPVLYYNLYVLTGLITLVWAINANAGIAYIPTIFVLPASYYIFLRLFQFNEKNIFYLTIGLFLSALLSIIFIWPSYFGIQWFSFLLNRDSSKTGSTQDTIRAGGILARAVMAMLLASLIPFLYNFGIFYFKKYRKYVHFAGIILVLTLVLTLNRMHFAATCLGVGLVLWYAIKEKIVKANLGFIIVSGALFLAVVVYVISLNGNDYMDTIDRSTWNGRLEQYNAAFNNFKYSAGLGIGMNNFLVSPVSSALLSGVNGAFDAGNTVHDDYLRVLSEYGAFGLIFYLSFFISTFRTKIQAAETNPLVRGAKINILVIALIGVTATALNEPTTLIISGIYLAIIKYYKEKPSSELLSNLHSKYS